MKPGVFSQLHTQLVFAVKNRECLLSESIRKEVFSHMAGLLKNKKHKPIIVSGYSDHVHVFLGMNPNMSTSDLVADLKRSSSLFINEKKIFPGKFQWQDGYGAFSYSKSHVGKVYQYLANQSAHHGKIRFKDEYIEMLEKFEIEYDVRYLFDFFD